jgi:hypothetical protein
MFRDKIRHVQIGTKSDLKEKNSLDVGICMNMYVFSPTSLLILQDYPSDINCYSMKITFVSCLTLGLGSLMTSVGILL